MHKIIGNNIVEKVNNIESEIANTDIDKVFELLLDTAEKTNTAKEDMPSHIIIISDMEFDQGTYSKKRH